MTVTVMTLAPDVGRCHHYDRSMSRWEPNARGRLEQAALALYGERGFEQVTVAEIAGRAGLTERTFFRHYADKREVLFAGSSTLQEFLVRAVTAASADVAPIDVVVAALEAGSENVSRSVEGPYRRSAVSSAS